MVRGHAHRVGHLNVEITVMATLPEERGSTPIRIRTWVRLRRLCQGTATLRKRLRLGMDTLAGTVGARPTGSLSWMSFRGSSFLWATRHGSELGTIRPIPSWPHGRFRSSARSNRPHTRILTCNRGALEQATTGPGAKVCRFVRELQPHWQNEDPNLFANHLAFSGWPYALWPVTEDTSNAGGGSGCG
jgi:hypothetical protein